MRRAPRLVPRLSGVVVLCVAALTGCGGGPPRRPVPPDQREGATPRGDVVREHVRVRGIGDEWSDGLTLIDGLKRQGGVEDCFRDRTDGSFVVVYNSQRTTRDELGNRIVQIGRDEGSEWDPLWDDR